MRYAHIAGSDTPLAAIEGDAIASLAESGHATLDALIAAGPDAWAATADAARSALDSAAARPLAETKLAAPLKAPSKIIAIGLNYMDHIRETGRTSRSARWSSPSSSTASPAPRTRSGGPPG